MRRGVINNPNNFQFEDGGVWEGVAKSDMYIGTNGGGGAIML